MEEDQKKGSIDRARAREEYEYEQVPTDMEDKEPHPSERDYLRRHGYLELDRQGKYDMLMEHREQKRRKTEEGQWKLRRQVLRAEYLRYRSQAQVTEIAEAMQRAENENDDSSDELTKELKKDHLRRARQLLVAAKAMLAEVEQLKAKIVAKELKFELVALKARHEYLLVSLDELKEEALDSEERKTMPRSMALS